MARKTNLPKGALTDWMQVDGSSETEILFSDEIHVASSGVGSLSDGAIRKRMKLSATSNTNFDWACEEVVRHYRKGWVCTMTFHPVDANLFCITRIR